MNVKNIERNGNQATITVEIDNRHNFVCEQCAEYLCNDCVPAFRVAVSTADMQSYQASCGRPMTLPEAESYLLYRRICERMPATLRNAWKLSRRCCI